MNDSLWKNYLKKNVYQASGAWSLNYLSEASASELHSLSWISGCRQRCNIGNWLRAHRTSGCLIQIWFGDDRRVNAVVLHANIIANKSVVVTSRYFITTLTVKSSDVLLSERMNAHPRSVIIQTNTMLHYWSSIQVLSRHMKIMNCSVASRTRCSQLSTSCTMLHTLAFWNDVRLIRADG